MMALGLQPGDEVITAIITTFIATAEVIALLKLTPVLVDVDPGTFNIDPKAIERAITPKTKAIVPVHLFGQCAPHGRNHGTRQEAQSFCHRRQLPGHCVQDYIFKDGTKKKERDHRACWMYILFPLEKPGLLW